MIYYFPLQLKKYLFFIEQYSGFLSILNKETNEIYTCNTPSIQMNYDIWCIKCFENLINPFTVEEMIDFHQWAISSSYIGIENSPMNWTIVRELTSKKIKSTL